MFGTCYSANITAKPRFSAVGLSRCALKGIRYLWLTYHHEIEDLLPKIYQSVMEKEYCELAPERLVNKLDDDFWQTSNEIADKPEARLIASLLNIEAKHQTINQRQEIYQALNQQIKQQKMSQESAIYLGYKSKQAKNIDKAASTICEAVSFRTFLSLRVLEEL